MFGVFFLIIRGMSKQLTRYSKSYCFICFFLNFLYSNPSAYLKQVRVCSVNVYHTKNVKITDKRYSKIYRFFFFSLVCLLKTSVCCVFFHIIRRISKQPTDDTARFTVWFFLFSNSCASKRVRVSSECFFYHTKNVQTTDRRYNKI